jgi:predicted DNA-binding protein
MTSQTVQLRVTLPVELQSYLKVKASKFGLNMSSYIKNLIINDVKDMDYTVMKASDRTEKAYEEALAKRSQAKKIDDLEDFFKKL